MPRHLKSSGSRQKVLPRSGGNSQATGLLRSKAKSTPAVTESTSRGSVTGICNRVLRFVKVRFIIFLVTGNLSAEATQAAWDAELQLDRIAAHEDVAEIFEAATIQTDRQQFAEAYRRLVGVHPQQRQEFREALERIQDGGGLPVAVLFDILNRR